VFTATVSWNDILFLIQGAGNTLAITLLALAGGTLLGVVFGLVRAGAPWWVNGPLGALLDVFRSVPLLIQLIVANAFKPMVGISWSNFTVACVVLAVYGAAYCTEIVRAGVLAVPVTTRRAARSLGLTWRQDLTSIVFPMALRVALPSWIGLALGLMKDSALVLWLGIIELLRSAQIIITRTQEPLLVLSIAGAIYFALSFPIARIGDRLERSWTDRD
jgi:hydroxyproline transport system permease protein